MTIVKMKYTINNRTISFHVEGMKKFGANEILLLQEDDLTAGTLWKKKGYTIDKFLDSDSFLKLKKGITEIIVHNILKIKKYKTGEFPKNFKLEDYHKLVNDKEHQQLINSSKNFLSEKMPVDVKIITKRISEICKTALTNTDTHYHLSLFHLRIVRPHSKDNNPIHRDVWLDNLKNAVNIYVPIAGSNRLSSLCLIPGSHYWKESEVERTKNGAKIKNLNYTVPAVTGAKRKLNMLRPNPKENEVLVFSPYLIHGGAVNLNKNKTRVSLEMRFWRKK